MILLHDTEILIYAERLHHKENNFLPKMMKIALEFIMGGIP